MIIKLGLVHTGRLASRKGRRPREGAGHYQAASHYGCTQSPHQVLHNNMMVFNGVDEFLRVYEQSCQFMSPLGVPCR